MQRDLEDLIIPLAVSLLIFLSTISIVNTFLVNLNNQGIFQNNTSDILAFTAIIVSLLTMAITLGWNIWIHRKASDVYQPVVSVNFKGLPPYKREGEETIVSITNVGKRNLIPSDVYFQYSWKSDREKVDLGEFAAFIAPEETYDFSIKFEEPVTPKVYSVTLHIADNETGFAWRTRRMFYIPSIEESITGKL